MHNLMGVDIPMHEWLKVHKIISTKIIFSNLEDGVEEWDCCFYYWLCYTHWIKQNLQCFYRNKLVQVLVLPARLSLSWFPLVPWRCQRHVWGANDTYMFSIVLGSKHKWKRVIGTLDMSKGTSGNQAVVGALTVCQSNLLKAKLWTFFRWPHRPRKIWHY